MSAGYKPASANGSGGPPSGPAGGVLSGTYPNPGFAGGAVTQPALGPDAMPPIQLLTNPGFNYAQLQVPGTLTTIADAAVGPDAWKVTRENADVQYQRITQNGQLTTNAGRFKKITANGKFMVYQPLESQITLALCNNDVTYTCKFTVAASVGPYNMRLWIFRYTAGGAPNAVVPTPIGAWNGVNVQPTLAAGFSSIATVALGALGSGSYQFSVTSGVLPQFGANDTLCVALTTDTQIVVGDTIDMFEQDLSVGTGGQFNWRPLSESEDRSRVERFIEKSFDVDTNPGTATLVGAVNLTMASAAARYPMRFKRAKPTNPTMTYYNPNSGATGTWRDTTAGADDAVASVNLGTQGVGVGITGVDTNNVAGHYLANASL